MINREKILLICISCSNFLDDADLYCTTICIYIYRFSHIYPLSVCFVVVHRSKKAEGDVVGDSIYSYSITFGAVFFTIYRMDRIGSTFAPLLF